MLRICRYVIMAAVGWLTLCAQHPDPAAIPEKRKGDARVGDALTNIASTYRQQAERSQRPSERQPCGPAVYKSNDDLCAQWKAADAAEKSAWWAAFAGWFGGLSFLGVLGAIGMAFHSNWIARDTAKRQLRAYVTLDSMIPVYSFMDEHKHLHSIKCQINLLNTGQTPAKVIYAMLDLIVAPKGGVIPDFPAKKRESFDVYIGAGKESLFGQTVIARQYLIDSFNKNCVIYGMCRFAYEDIFQEKHMVSIRCRIDVLIDIERAESVFGNLDNVSQRVFELVDIATTNYEF